MNYRYVYMRIVSHARKEMSLGKRPTSRFTKYKFSEYYEGHHILPRSLFPNWSNRKSNIVMLTAREHYFCHQLLTKIYPNSTELQYALYCFINFARYKKVINSKDFEKLRAEYSKLQKLRLLGSNNPNYGHKLSEESKEKISKANKGRKPSDKQMEKLKSQKWYTNGIDNILTSLEPPDGYYRGRTLNKEWVEKANIARSTVKQQPHNNGKRLFNNGVIEVYDFECPEGFKPGHLPNWTSPCLGKKQSKESIEKMLETRRLKKLEDKNYGVSSKPRGGWHHTDETKQKLRELALVRSNKNK